MKYLFLGWVVGFLYLMIRIYGYLIHKSLEAFSELRQARIALKQAQNDLKK